MSNRQNSSQRGFSLIEILVVLAVLTILGGISYNYLIGGKDKNGVKIKTPYEAGKSTACLMNLQQVRLGIKNFKLADTDSEKNPESFADLKFPRESLICPDTKQEYLYDKETGEAHCPAPGHEKN